MSDDETAQVVLCCLLRAVPGAEPDLTRYEDAVLALLPDHGGAVVSRVVGAGDDGAPHEVQVLRFAGQQGIDAYLADPRRTALADERDRVVASTRLFGVTPR